MKDLHCAVLNAVPVKMSKMLQNTCTAKIFMYVASSIFRLCIILSSYNTNVRNSHGHSIMCLSHTNVRHKY